MARASVEPSWRQRMGDEAVVRRGGLLCSIACRSPAWQRSNARGLQEQRLLVVGMLMGPPPRGQRTRRVCVHIHAEQQVRVLASSTSGPRLHGSGVGAVKGARSPWKSSGARGRPLSL